MICEESILSTYSLIEILLTVNGHFVITSNLFTVSFSNVLFFSNRISEHYTGKVM